MIPTTSDRTTAFLARTAYIVAAVLIILPLIDIAIGTLPLQTSNIRWRVGIIGLATGALALPIIGLFIALVTAYVRDHRGTQYFLVAAAAISSLILLALVVLFTLDTLQLRNEIVPDARRMYDRVAVKGIVAQLILVVALAMMAVGGWRTSRASLREARTRSRRADSGAIVVGKAADGRASTTPLS